MTLHPDAIILGVILGALIAWWLWRPRDGNDFDLTVPAYVPTLPRLSPRADRLHRTHADAERLWYIACHGKPLSRRDAAAHNAWSERRWRRAHRFCVRAEVMTRSQTPLMDYDAGMTALLNRYETDLGLRRAGRYVSPESA